MSDTITISVDEYWVLVTSSQKLLDIKRLIASDPVSYGHLDSAVEKGVEMILGIKREEKETA